MDMGSVDSRVANWFIHLPDVHPFYSLRCNWDPVLLQLLADRGIGFSCSSRQELDIVNNLSKYFEIAVQLLYSLWIFMFKITIVRYVLLKSCRTKSSTAVAYINLFKICRLFSREIDRLFLYS